MSEVTPEAVQITIRACRSKGHFKEATQYIDALPDTLCKSTAVVIEIIQLYLIQGHYKTAAGYCERVSTSIPKLSYEDGTHQWIENPQITAFELLKAFVWVSRYSQLKTSLKKAQFIGNMLGLCPGV
jgi:hypothetical protein